MNPTLSKATCTSMVATWLFCSLFPAQNTLGDEYNAAYPGNAANSQFAVSSSEDMVSYKVPPLPLTLIKFTAAKTSSGKVELVWKTAQEINVSHFTIERSADGRIWTKIGTKASKGQQGSVETYNFIDPSPVDNTNYYRLYVMDFDYHTDYSPVRLVNFNKETPVRIYPTLAKTNTTIYVEGISPEITLVEIFNNDGRPVQKVRLYSNTFNTTGLTAGIYHVRITNMSNMSAACSQKIVIY